jgi:hypothetical protein
MHKMISIHNHYSVYVMPSRGGVGFVKLSDAYRGHLSC